MNNIFENAYFGKPYKTRDGKKILFQCANADCVCLVTEEHCISYNFDGTVWGIFEPENDIVSEWQKPIDEEELDKLAEEYFVTTYNQGNNNPSLNIINEKKFAVADFKAGCHKMLEVLNERIEGKNKQVIS